MRSRTLALWLAGAVPFAAYVLTCSGHGYWLDSGEFVAASVRLDIAHPPGHPLSLVYGKLWSLLPLGSLPFRIAVGQAAATAIASVCLCLASAAVLKRQGVADSLRWPCALLAAWTSAFTYGLWFQAVRPEVYALQTLCTSLILERVASFLAAEPSEPPARFAGPACFALGLGLANHHFTALLVVPGLLVPTIVLLRRGRLRTLGGAALIGLAGLACYAYLPLRAAKPLAANLGQPDSWARFQWVVSARVYAQGTGNRDDWSLAERLADVAVLLVESFHGLPLAAAAVGLYALLRVSQTRAHGAFLLLLIVPNLVARAWLGPVRNNPDVLGYFGSSLLAIGLLVGCALGAALSRLAEYRAWPERTAIAFPFLALLNLPAAWARSTLSDFTATDSFDAVRVRSLPPRAIAVETMPQSVFRHWELDAVERVRPDVALLPVPFLTHPGMSEALVRREPSAAGIVFGYLQGDLLRCADLQAAARARPVLLEVDPRVPPACYPLLSPEYLAHRVHVTPPRLSAAELHERLAETYAGLYSELGPAVGEIETLRQLLATHYLSAAHFAALGERGLARDEIERALRLAPDDRNVQALAAALEEGEGPLAVGAFLKL